ncbi:MAG: hypothetical protein HQL74_01995 [Magnetococcales bacterium]|nr:hypothetical protein [Magnetococcales bacterium]
MIPPSTPQTMTSKVSNHSKETPGARKHPDVTLLDRWILGILVVGLLVIPALTGRDAIHPPYDESRLIAIREVSPDYLFLGNSMLASRIDHRALSQRLGGAKSVSFTLGGVFSPHWYLWLKNDVIPSGIRPRRVFIFFREDDLTSPYRSVSQPDDIKNLLRASRGKEEELERVLAQHRDFKEAIEHILMQIYPIQLKHSDMSWLLDSWAFVPILPGYGKAVLARMIGEKETPQQYQRFLEARRRFKEDLRYRLFKPSELRPMNSESGTRGVKVTEEPFNFYSRLPNSLLPEMIRLNRQHHLNLVFFMVKPRPGGDGTIQQPKALAAYTKDLKQWLEDNGAGFYDSNPDLFPGPDDYYDQWHVRDEVKEKFTQYFIDSLPGYFNGSTP